MRCPDCQKEVGFSRVYCPHCSGTLLKNKKNFSNNSWVAGFKLNAEIL